MADYLPHSDKIIDGMSFTYKEATLAVSFGYGYKQVAPNGIDSIKYSTVVSMNNLTETMVDTITTFLRTVGSAIPFRIALEGETDLVVLLVTNSYKRTPASREKTTIQFRIIEHKYPGVSP